MKAILKHIALKKIAKHVNRSTCIALGEFLLSEGYTKDRGLLTKGRHQFVFAGKGNRYVVSYRKLEEVTA